MKLMSHVHQLCQECGGVLKRAADTQCPHCGAAIASSELRTEWMGETMVHSGSPQSEASPEAAGSAIEGDLLGRTLDVYRIERLLGRGGMAYVFLAEHKNLHRPCALKILCPEFQGRQRNSIDLFLEEARTAASIVHPHIVTVHNVGEAEGRHFIELEFVDGQALDEVIVDERPNDIESIGLMTQAVSALAAAHSQGLVHRDFKPANIMVSRDGIAKLADFGLAKQLKDIGQRSSIAGTPYYMAPELFRGEAATASSDVYAFGVSLFRLLADEYPFHHANWTDLAKLHVEEEAPDLSVSHPHLEHELVQLVRRCLAKDSKERPQDANELNEKLQAIYRSMRDLRGLVAAAFAETPGVRWREHGVVFEISVDLPDGRSQRVTVEEGAAEIGTTSLVRIFTICSPVKEDYLRRALELNAEIPHGALSIQELDGEAFFVMVNNYPRSTCDVEEIRHSVLDLAKWGDAVEEALTGEDQF